jgi:hypothetical protein
MKRQTFLIAAAAALLSSVVSTASAQSVRLLTQITDIIPSQAMAGQTITVKITRNELLLNPVLKEIRPAALKNLVGRFPGRTGNQTTKIFFTGATAGSFVEAQNLTRVNDDTFTVRVPNGARSGPMRLQMGIATSVSRVNFTLTSVGFTFANLSQFNVVSVKIDNVERLAAGQVIAAVPHTSPNVNILDVGTTAGNHNIQVTVGIDAARPIMVLFFPTRAAQTLIAPNQGFNNPIPLGLMLGGEYLASSPNAVSVVGSSRTVSWQSVQVQANGTLVVHGFDFTFNSSTGVTTFKHWIGDRPNVVAEGTVVEPTAAQWGINLPAVNLPLRRSNGSNYTVLNVNLAGASMTATDGLVYEMQ